VNLLYKTMVQDLTARKPLFIEYLDQNTVNRLFMGGRANLGKIDLAQTLEIARASGIRAVVVGNLLTISSHQPAPKRTQKKAYKTKEEEYEDKGKKKTRRVSTSTVTYHIVSQRLQIKCEADYKIWDTATGQVLTVEMLQETGSDAVEYAEYEGEIKDLWVERGLFRKSWKPLADEEKRFKAKRKPDSVPIISDVVETLGHEISDRTMAFLDAYNPNPKPAVPASQFASAIPWLGYHKIITLTGRDTKDTDSFLLASGKVKMAIRVWGSPAGSSATIRLESEKGRELSGAEVALNSAGSEEERNDTTVRNVMPGEYYVQVKSNGQWEVIVYQQR